MFSNKKRKRPAKKSVFVNPADLKASELRALVALLAHGRAAPIASGCIFTTESIFRTKVVDNLLDIGLVRGDSDKVELTSAGTGIALSFKDRPIMGYD